MIFFGSPTFLWVAEWRIVKLALKNKQIYFRDNSSFAFLLLIAYNATEGMSGSPELSCNQPRWGRESWLLCFACLPGVL